MNLKITNIVASDHLVKISCDKVVNDFYPLSNLTRSKSKLPASKSGFMVERFVKPPVVITVELAKLTKIIGVDIGLQVGSQKTCALEIFAGDRLELMRKVAYISRSNLQSNTPVAAYTSARFFVKRWEREIMEHQQMDNCKCQSFNNTFALDKCKFLSIKICSADYVPCLSFLNIWMPIICENDAKPLPEIVPSAADDLSAAGTSRTLSFVDSETIVTDQRQLFNLSDDCIPEEFYDTITWECMSLPVLLPCGKTIDRSTLEKYLAVEATCGRSPNDPYTGVAFNDSCFPLANSYLKSRLDKFFFDNPQLAKKLDIGRTCCGKTYTVWPPRY